MGDNLKTEENDNLFTKAKNNESQILRCLALSERTLYILVGNKPKESDTSKSVECLFDIMEENSTNLCKLEKNLDEIANIIIN